MDLEVQNAIEVAWNPASDASLKNQAFDYLNQLRSNPAACQTCLALFTSNPRQSDVVRHVALEIVINAIQTRQLEPQALQSVRDTLMAYIRSVYVARSQPQDSTVLQNKVAQLMTHLFTVLYASSWESFFADLRAFVEEELRNPANGSPATLLYLRILASVHDDTADVLIQNSPERLKENTQLKDLIRARDAAPTAASWQQILSHWTQLESATVQMCLKTISRWVSWTDISLIANQAILSQLFDIAGRKDITSGDPAIVSTRDAAIDVFTEIVAKKMPPAEKVQLIQFMNLDAVVAQLVASDSLHAARGTSDYDHDMAETVAKLVNNVMLDLVNILDKGPQAGSQAEQLLQTFAPYLLRFFSDEFDEVCSTVIGSLTELLTLFRKLAQKQGQLPSPYSELLSPILSAVVAKMRYDETSDWGEDDAETDEAEFAELRKRLKVLQQIIAATSESLFIDTLNTLVSSTFERYKIGKNDIDWRDLDLAMLETYLLGELAMRNGGLYQKRAPSSAASQCLEQLMITMTEADIASFPHPAIHIQYLEICMRYSAFFEQHPEHTPGVLQYFVQFAHSPNERVRARCWPMLLRFVRSLRNQLSSAAEPIVAALSDLLEIRAIVPEENGDDDSSNQGSQAADHVFQGQLFLFEAIGCLASVPSLPAQTQINMVRSIVTPLMTSIQDYSTSAASGNEQATLQIHHLIEAIGVLARGYSDWVPGKNNLAIHDDVSAEFQKASDTILTALGTLKGFIAVRQAARFAFSRMIGVLGFKILQQLPQWIDGFLTESSTTKDEMATFLRLLDQVIYGFKTQIYDVLDTLLTPLLERIFAAFNEPTTGTDDEMHMGELRREYLNFLLVLLNNDLDSVLVSSRNQATFDTIIGAVEHFAKDTSEHPDAKLAVAVFTRMCETWGGPDIFNPKVDNADSTATSQPKLPGFDQFMMTRFSPLTWTIVTNPAFSPKDAQANKVVGEIAILQQAILAKCGTAYVRWLRDSELRGLGAHGGAADDYLRALTTMDNKGFKAYLLNFLAAARG